WIELEFERHGVVVSWDRDFPAWAPALAHCADQVAAAERGPRVAQAIGEALNPMIEVVWHHLAKDDQRLFLDRFYSRFMSHWVPIPLVTGRRLLALLREGKLTVERGLPERIAGFDVVIDATGAPRHIADCESPLLESLAV